MLFLPQARALSQSELTTHSGRQPAYGSPKYSGLQVHWQLVPRTAASAFDPQGFGLHGSLGGGGAGEKRVIIKHVFFLNCIKVLNLHNNINTINTVFKMQCRFVHILDAKCRQDNQVIQN